MSKLSPCSKTEAVKTPAQYGGKPLGTSKATNAVKHAAQLVDVAEALIL